MSNHIEKKKNLISPIENIKSIKTIQNLLY